MFPNDDNDLNTRPTHLQNHMIVVVCFLLSLTLRYAGTKLVLSGTTEEPEWECVFMSRWIYEQKPNEKSLYKAREKKTDKEPPRTKKDQDCLNTTIKGRAATSELNQLS